RRDCASYLMHGIVGVSDKELFVVHLLVKRNRSRIGFHQLIGRFREPAAPQLRHVHCSFPSASAVRPHGTCDGRVRMRRRQPRVTAFPPLLSPDLSPANPATGGFASPFIRRALRESWTRRPQRSCRSITPAAAFRRSACSRMKPVASFWS